MNWTAYTLKPRIQVIEDLKDIVSRNDAFIVNHEFFSDLGMLLSIQTEARHILKLYKEIGDLLEIDHVQIGHMPSPNKEVLIQLNVSFSQGQGNLKTEVPE